MKKISRKLVTSSLAMAFATVALGTTTFAWFTTNAQVTANITVGVQSTTDSIQISNDCRTWKSSTEIDASDLELTALTYNAAAATLSVDDTITEMDGVTNGAPGQTSAANYLQFVLYLKVSSVNKPVYFDVLEGDTEVTNTGTIAAYTALADFTADATDKDSNAVTTANLFNFETGDTLYVDAKNALRSVVDVSAGGIYNQNVAKAQTTDTALAAAFAGGISYTRMDNIINYTGEGAVTTTTDGKYNFGQGLGATNAANSYIHEVLGTDFTTENTAETNYAAHALTKQYSSIENPIFTTEATVAEGVTAQIYALRFTYWLEGYDADCFDAIMGQSFSIDLGFTTSK